MTIGPESKVIQWWEDKPRNRRYEIITVSFPDGYAGRILSTQATNHNVIGLSDYYKTAAGARRWLEKAEKRDNE